MNGSALQKVAYSSRLRHRGEGAVDSPRMPDRAAIL